LATTTLPQAWAQAVAHALWHTGGLRCCCLQQGPGMANGVKFQPPATYWNGQWDLPQKETTDSFGTSLKGDINLGSVTFTSITGYQEVDAYVRFDSDASPLNYVNVVFSDDNWQFSQELRLASDTAERFQWIAGAYYYRDSVRAANNFDIARFARVLFGAPPNLADPTAPISIDQTYLQKTESYAVFASTTYRLTDQFKATAGLRWTRDSKSLDYQTGADAARAIGIPFLIDVDRERSWNAVTGNATLDYQVNDDILTYASYNRGFKSGVFNAAPFFSAADVNSANPEKVDAYEIGLKNTLLDNRLRLNLAAFYNNFSNLQVFQFIPDATTGIPTSRYSNAGSARVKGVEFEVQVQATEGLFFQLAGAALDAKYKTFIAVADNPTTPANETQDLSGNRLNAAPKFNISGVVEYVLPISNDWLVTPRYEFTYNSRQFFTSENTAALSQKAYGIHNASLALANTAHDVELTLFIKNLTGTRYNNEILPLPDFGFNGEIRGARQSYGATLSYKF
ncbi:MAG: TonB-dependent receptor, partial [Rhodospirillaceae bacterium]|nr:TonB-dependent receptor [Rhodospirillaceae bacterium]